MKFFFCAKLSSALFTTIEPKLSLRLLLSGESLWIKNEPSPDIDKDSTLLHGCSLIF
jgi:hypothetical protein